MDDKCLIDATERLTMISEVMYIRIQSKKLVDWFLLLSCCKRSSYRSDSNNGVELLTSGKYVSVEDSPIYTRAEEDQQMLSTSPVHKKESSPEIGTRAIRSKGYNKKNKMVSDSTTIGISF